MDSIWPYTLLGADSLTSDRLAKMAPATAPTTTPKAPNKHPITYPSEKEIKIRNRPC